MTSLLPTDFRCLRHITFFYARNLPLLKDLAECERPRRSVPPTLSPPQVTNALPVLEPAAAASSTGTTAGAVAASPPILSPPQPLQDKDAADLLARPTHTSAADVVDAAAAIAIGPHTDEDPARQPPVVASSSSIPVSTTAGGGGCESEPAVTPLSATPQPSSRAASSPPAPLDMPPPAAAAACSSPATPHCVSSYFILRCPGGGEGEGEQPGAVVFRSEVCEDTLHPTWRCLPADVVARHGALTTLTFELFYCANPLQCGRAEQPAGAGLEDRDDILVFRSVLDLTTLQYVGRSVMEADEVGDALPSATATGGPFTLFTHCVDGVFTPGEVGSPAVQTVVTNGEVAWSRSPAGVGMYAWGTLAGRHGGAGAGPRAAAPSDVTRGGSPASTRARRLLPCGMTLGDVKTLTTATTAWHLIGDIAEARREEQLHRIDAESTRARPHAITSAATATLQARLTEANERLTLATLELERLRAEVERKQRALMHQEEALEAVLAPEWQVTHGGGGGGVEGSRSSPQAWEKEVREEELLRADVRAQLARCRQQRTQELRELFPVELAEQFAVPCRVVRNAKDTIQGATLPILFVDRSEAEGRYVFVASTAEVMTEEAVALGYVVQVLHTLAILYDCVLPYPLLMAGPRSRVLARPGLSVAQAVSPFTGAVDDKYPLYCTRVTDRPLMTTAVRLLLKDAVVLAKAMGKEVDRVLAQGLRLGTVVSALLET